MTFLEYLCVLQQREDAKCWAHIPIEHLSALGWKMHLQQQDDDLWVATMQKGEIIYGSVRQANFHSAVFEVAKAVLS